MAGLEAELDGALSLIGMLGAFIGLLLVWSAVFAVFDRRKK